ncbi:MAG: flagellar protein FliS [Lachnospiraceae bacterium]|nr:flagellar protein FliS [Lachnospiraceae bacterium]
MTKEEKNVFSLRIANSSKTELIVITYDIIINYVNAATHAYSVEDLDLVVFNLQKAKQFLNNLSSCLDFEYGISYELMNLYIYVNNCLVRDIAKRKPESADIIKSVIEKLRASFDVVSVSDTSGKVMKNSERVYVGYTYGRTSTLNEVVVR